MSVLVKGMEMPTECRKCPFNEFGTMSGETWCGVNGVTLAKNFEAIDFDGKPDWCPLVALPDKHGKLVDADELIIDLMDRGLEGIQTDDWAEIQQTVMRQPTIVEAEGENADHE